MDIREPAGFREAPASVAAREVLRWIESESRDRREQFGEPGDEFGDTARRASHEIALPSDEDSPLVRAGFRLTTFQIDAVRRALTIVRARGGVLIADSVGLGKTYIGLGLIERFVRDGLRRVLVVAPAALRSHWLFPLRKLARALGLPFSPTPDHPPTGAAWLAFRSHTALACRREDLLPAPPHLIVVDESHAFRNPRTQRARALARLCVHARVVLISATPINNSLADLYTQLRLFLGDAALADIGVPDLRATFRAKDAHRDPNLVRAIRAVVVRRTRATLTSHYAGDARLVFPHRAPPVAIRYDLRGGDAATGLLAALDLAPFRLRLAGGTIRVMDAGPELFRFVLLKRLESGTAALRQTIRRLDQYLAAFVRAASASHLLTPREHRTDAADGDQLLLDAVVLRPWPRHLPMTPFCQSARRDRERLETLAAQLDQCADGKLARFEHLLREEIAGQKVLVFTEFRDTAMQLHRALGRWPGVARIDGGGAWIASGRTSRASVIAAFSPESNRARPPAGNARVDVLIATDVLAEGLDLQDAGIMISYDMPWNPVRLMQRLGRIDRLGSRHAIVHTYCFLPGDALDGLLGLLGRIDAKLDTIRRGLGAGDTLTDLSALAAGNAPDLSTTAVVAAVLRGDADLYGTIERTHEPPLESHSPMVVRRGVIPDLPWAAVVTCANVSQRVFLLCLLQSDAFHIVRLDRMLSFDDSSDVDLLRRMRDAGNCGEVGPRFDREAFAQALSRCRATALASAPNASIRRIAAAVTRLAAGVRGGIDASACARIDHIFAALRLGLRRGMEAEIEAILADRSIGRTGAGRESAREMNDVLTRLERVIGEAPSASPATAHVLAVFELRPPAAASSAIGADLGLPTEVSHARNASRPP